MSTLKLDLKLFVTIILRFSINVQGEMSKFGAASAFRTKTAILNNSTLENV